ncbi:hypothetical protein KQH82_01415 [bacterium]|nr:hypothetical protein [bacterium]
MYKLLPIFALMLIAACAAHAVELQSTPIQDAMTFSLASDGWADEFDDDKPTEPANKQQEGDSFEEPRRKSTVKAALLSALVPGAGEYYLGNKKKARYFFAAEALTWVGYLSFKVYGNWKEDDYIRFAQANANAQLADKDDEFRDLVGFYTSIDEYNSFGRVFDPERPYLTDTPDNHWRWQNQQDQETYRHLKNRAREADRRSDFMLGVAVVGRIISVIDAIRDGQRLNKQLTAESFSMRDRPDMKLSINPFSSKTQISLTFYTDFR